MDFGSLKRKPRERTMEQGNRRTRQKGGTSAETSVKHETGRNSTREAANHDVHGIRARVTGGFGEQMDSRKMGGGGGGLKTRKLY